MTSPLFQTVQVHAEDGFPLTVQRFDPQGLELQAAVVIGCATGVHARFYRDFAIWLAAHGVGVCTFDYRYSGLSFPPPYDAKSFTPEQRHEALLTCPRDVNLIDTWGRKDFGAVIRYASKQWHRVPLTVMGHSLGGNLMTLISSEWPRVARYLSLNAGNAYYFNQPNSEQNQRFFTDTVVEPLEREGVWRASRLQLGQDLPYGCGKEWIKWYFDPLFSLHNLSDRFLMQSFNTPFLFIGCEDDTIQTKVSMEQYMSMLPTQTRSKSDIHSLWIDPRKAPPPALSTHSAMISDNAADGKRWPPVGHVGAFQVASPPDTLTKQETIWRVMLEWIHYGNIVKNVGEFRSWGLEDKRDLGLGPNGKAKM